MLTAELLFVTGTLIIIFFTLFYILFKKISNLKTASGSEHVLVPWLQSMQQSLEKTNANITTALNQNNRNVAESLSRSTEIINKRLDSAVGVVADASKEIARMNEIGKSIKDLQFMLQSPKLRGNLGEEVLADMLAQVFPKSSFFLQHTFKSGARVDAAINTVAGTLCIDAKFPVENYQNKVKAET